MRPLWAVVLAAGSGRRFGSNKLVATLRGRPLVLQTLEHLTAARRSGLLAGIVTVTAAGDEAVAHTIAQSGSVLVENPAPASGMGQSLLLGIRRLDHPPVEPRAEAAVIVLADQPMVRQEVLAALRDAWLGGADIVRPVYSCDPGVPGHPVLLDRSRWHLVDDVRGDRGLGPTLGSHTDWVMTVTVEGSNPDIDTPADLAVLEDEL
jgi:CTP:molybdopterin cytidylyltransferase MocA